MKRRDFVQELAAVGLTVLAPRVLYAFQTSESNLGGTDVKRVLVMFKCHLDVGFIDTQANVVHKYFAQYYPQAIETAATMRQSGEDRYVWTTGSWLLYEYLEGATGPERKRMEQAVSAGDIVWHALPFTWHSTFFTVGRVETVVDVATIGQILTKKISLSIPDQWWLFKDGEQ